MAFGPLPYGLSLSDYCQGVIDGRYDIKQPVKKQVEAGKFADAATWADQLLPEWHPALNGVLTPQHVTAGSTTKVWWQCAHGHTWEAAICSRSKGNGCPVCSGRQVLAGFNDIATNNLDLAAEWHPTLNGELTSQHVTARTNKKAWWPS